MQPFTYHNDSLYCENIPVAHIARAVGTPFYLYSQAALEQRFQALRQAFSANPALICYSAKANSNQALLTLFRKSGAGLDIVSGGELFRGLRAGFDPRTIVYSGVGKTADEIDAALGHDILMINVESLEELALVNERAGALNRCGRIGIRINPDVDARTHPYISTGLKNNKFGIDSGAALEAYKAAARLPHIEAVGIACHLGSQITALEPYRQALESLARLRRELQAAGILLHYLDMGGGLGITYDQETPPALEEYARVMTQAAGQADLRLIIEPGRALCGPAAALVTRVLYRKQTAAKLFIVVDAGMNDLMRPALYGAHHAVRPVQKFPRPTVVADVVGPICESSDVLAKERSLPDVQRNELLALMDAGAYGFAMSSNYCSRARAAEVMVNGDLFDIVRQREGLQDLVRGEQLPLWWSAAGG